MSFKKELEYEIDENGCWVVTSHCCDGSGYPHFRRDGKIFLIHRYMFMKNYGEIDSSVLLRHKCDNSKCCNPEHLEIGTHADNVADRVERGRSAKGSQNGRAKLTEDNVRFIRNDIIHNNAQLARMFNVDRKAIIKIKQFQTWKHVI